MFPIAQERKEQLEPRNLLQRMLALERFPSSKLVASPHQYAHAEVCSRVTLQEKSLCEKKLLELEFIDDYDSLNSISTLQF
jgi:hypothetical protein